MPDFRLRLSPRPPFRLDLTAWALRRRPHNIVDRFDGGIYSRILTLGETAVEVAVEQRGGAERPELFATISGHGVSRAMGEDVEARLARMLGLDRDLSEFYELAQTDSILGPMVTRLRGMKPVRFPTNFEAFVNAVTCQQISLDAGLHVVNRLVANYGRSPQQASEQTFAFPDSSVLAHADSERLRELGLSRGKARYLTALASLDVDAANPDFSRIDTLDDKAALAALCELKGVGRWTAEYVMLRGFGRLHIFPGDDVGGRNALARRMGLGGKLDYDGVHRALARWSRFSGLIYFHLLVDSLLDKRVIA
jgi:DNA-3-methyladenine glycosylase II